MDHAESNPFDMLSNDVLSRVLAECERHTETKRVCRRFAQVFVQYQLFRTVEHMFFADWWINLSGGTAHWCGIDTSPTRLAFHTKPHAARDCYAMWSSLCEENGHHCCWVSPKTHRLFVCTLVPTFRVLAAIDLLPYVQTLAPNAEREWKIELGATVVAVWAKGEGFFAVYELATLQLSLLCHHNAAIARVDRLALVGAAEHVAITVGKPVVQLMVVAKHSLEPLFAPIAGAAAALPVYGPDRQLAYRCVIVGPGGFVLDATVSAWDAHSVWMLDLREQRELWRLDDVTADANLRVPGARSSGLADRLVARSSALALCSGAVVSVASGDTLLQPFGAGDGVTSRDALHFLCDRDRMLVGRLLLGRQMVRVGMRMACVARFEPAVDTLRAARFHIIEPLTPLYGGAARGVSLTGMGFVVRNGVLVFGITHSKDGTCCVRAIRLPRDGSPKKTLWRAVLPDEMTGRHCTCALKQWRAKLYASHEKVTVLLYPVEPLAKQHPKVAFFWLDTGAQCGSVVTLAASTDTEKKCAVM